MSTSKPHIAIVGAGPIGLEAALAAADSGHPFTVYETGERSARHVRDWGHVRLFTPWDLSVSPRMRRALARAGRPAPRGGECPTGAELVARVLDPVSALPSLADHVRYAASVLRIGRTGLLKHEEIGTTVRGRHPFRLLLRDGSGREWTEEAEIVIDCTGNTEANALGDGAIPAPGEAAAACAITHGIPDVEGAPADWVSRRVLVVGAGHSATTAVVDLARLAEMHPDTHVVWALRGDVPEPDANDPLAQRASLMAAGAALAADPPACLRVRTGVFVDALTVDETGPTTSGRKDPQVGVRFRSRDGRVECIKVDRILALTGRVGDHLLYRQLQVHECWATQGPMRLAAALLRRGVEGDCLSQTSLGPETLSNPEPGLFILGVKSYGCRSDFLMRVGWEQVSETFELIRGC